MHDHDDGAAARPSATWTWKLTRVSPPPEADSRVARRASALHHLSKRELRSLLTLEVKHRGGAESWWEIRARGVTIRRPGYLSIDDVMRELYRQD